MFEDNYPEGLKRVFLIKGTGAKSFLSWFTWYVLGFAFGMLGMLFWVERASVSAAAPRMFPMAYNLIKHFLCEETRRKIIVLGSKSDVCCLPNHITISNQINYLFFLNCLYTFFSSQVTGRRSCAHILIPSSSPWCMEERWPTLMETPAAEQWWEDGITWGAVSYGWAVFWNDRKLPCSSLLLQIKYGGTVPRSYYVQDSVKVQYESSVTISRGSIFQLEYDVEAPSSLLRYKTTTKKNIFRKRVN